MATNALFDRFGGDPNDFGIVSNPQIEELLRKQKEDQSRMLAEQRTQNDKFDLGKQVEVEDEPGNNVFNTALLGMLRRGADEKAESFDEFFDRKFTALNFLGDMARGFAAGRTGTKFVSTRERLMDEYKVEQDAKLKRQEIEQRNQQVAVQIASQMDIQKENRLARAQEAAAGRTLQKTIADQVNAVREGNLAIAKNLAGPQKAKIEADIKLTEQRTKEIGDRIGKFNGTPFEGAMDVLIRQKGLESITVDDITEITKAMSEAQRGPKEAKPVTSFNADQVAVAQRMVQDGVVDLSGKGGILETFGAEVGAQVWRKLADGKTHVLKSSHPKDGFNATVADTTKAKESYDAFFELVKEAQIDTSKYTPNIKSRILGQIEEIKGTLGMNAAARLVAVFAPAKATEFAKSGGEVGVLTNEDIQRFLLMLPSLQDSQEILLRKQKFFEINYVRSIWGIVKGQGRIEPPDGREIRKVIPYEMAMELAADQNKSLEEWMVQAYESGYSLKGSKVTQVMGENGEWE